MQHRHLQLRIRNAKGSQQHHRRIARAPLRKGAHRQLRERLQRVQPRHIAAHRRRHQLLLQPTCVLHIQHIAKEHHMARARIFRQMQHRAHPADAAVRIGTTVLAGKPTPPFPPGRQQRCPVQKRRKFAVVLRIIKACAIAMQQPVHRPVHRFRVQILSPMPQRLHHVGVQIRPHSRHQIRQHALRQRHLESILQKRWIAKAARKILRHTHHAHRLTSLVKEHLVGHRRPAVAPRQMAADDEIAVAPRATVQHLLRKLDEARHRIRMDPAAVHQRIREARITPRQRHKAAV